VARRSFQPLADQAMLPRRFGMTREQVQAHLRHPTVETQNTYTHDDLANLRRAVKGIDFEQ
jgi:hypothetical protein